jgi:large subunit ribosomal protein L25
MTTDTATLQAELRTVLGKAVKDLRRQGITPLHLYGAGQPSDSLQASTADLRRVLLRVGTSQPVFLHVGSDRQLAFVQEIQFHPVRREVLHVDLLRVDVAKTVQVEVPVFLEGEAPAARVLGGTIHQALSTVLVECLPLEVPQSLHADVSGIDDFEKVVRVGDLTVPEGVVFITSPEQLLVQAQAPVASAEEEEAAAGSGIEAAAATEGGREAP